MKLTFREKIGFSLGEIGGTIGWQGMMFYLGFFYTDIFGLSAQAAGFLLFLPRFLDAFIDPIAGSIADRTNTRWGKFRPYFLWMSLPYTLLIVLLYTTPPFGYNGKLIYAYVTYMVMMVVYSFIMIPFNAMGGVISDDHRERTSVQSFRFTMAFAGAIIIRGFTNPLVKFFGGYDPSIVKATSPEIQQGLQNGFIWTMVVYGILSLICFMITFFSSRERVKPINVQKNSFKQDIKDLMANKPWLVLFLSSTINLVWVGVFSTAIAYYFKYYFTAKTLVLFGVDTGYDMMSTFNVFGSIVIIIILISPLTKYLTTRFGKRNSLMVCFIGVTIALAGFYFCPPESTGLILFFQFLQSASAACTMPIIWSMYADSADYSEWKTNRRATGLVFSAVVLGQKVGIALGAAIPMWILGAMDYSSETAVQPENILHGIRVSMGLIPAVFALLTGLSIVLYKLSNKDMDLIQAELKERREKLVGGS